MRIHGIGNLHAGQRINAPHVVKADNAGKVGGASGDHLDISPAAHAAAEAQESGEARQDVVSRVRAEIANGTYETPEKLDAALDRLLDSFS